MRVIYFPERSEATCGLKCPQSRQEHFWDTLFHKLCPQRLKFSLEGEDLQERNPELPSLSVYFSEAVENGQAGGEGADSLTSQPESILAECIPFLFPNPEKTYKL